MYKWKLMADGYRCINEDGKEFGECFQEYVRMPETKAASIVHQKYRRKYDLDLKDLHVLSAFVHDFSENRKNQNKSCSNDYMTQIASAELKRCNELKSRI